MWKRLAALGNALAQHSQDIKIASLNLSLPQVKPRKHVAARSTTHYYTKTSYLSLNDAASHRKVDFPR
jgi:hypothetical protein